MTEAVPHLVRHLGDGLPLVWRVWRVAAALSYPGGRRRSLSGHCEVAARDAAVDTDQAFRRQCENARRPNMLLVDVARDVVDGALTVGFLDAAPPSPKGALRGNFGGRSKVAPR